MLRVFYKRPETLDEYLMENYPTKPGSCGGVPPDKWLVRGQDIYGPDVVIEKWQEWPTNHTVKDFLEWRQSMRGCETGSEPLVLDLNGHGLINTVNVNNGVYFDFNATGFAEASGWVSPGEDLLCMDRNGNGVIDNGSELFGSLTPLLNGQLAANGLQALAALDSNGDGKIDAQDPAYSQLRGWVDSNSDGIS